MKRRRKRIESAMTALLSCALIGWGCEAERLIIAVDDEATDAARGDSGRSLEVTATGEPDAQVDPTSSSPGGSSSDDSNTPTPGTGSGPSSDGRDHSSRPPKSCMRNNECDSGAYCDMTRCVERGNCLSVPVVLDDVLRPVCGCDGITYYNNSYRQAARVGLDYAGECTDFAHTALCDPLDNGCPPPSVCARFFTSLSSTCEPSLPWTCWVVPAVCPSNSGDTDRWTSCATQDPAAATCLDTCRAIGNRGGGPYRRALSCP